jgi:serine/threonine protein kinase
MADIAIFDIPTELSPLTCLSYESDRLTGPLPLALRNIPSKLLSLLPNRLAMIGKTISHYQILEKLGEGGMGVVYKARDTRLERFVALKILPANRMVDPERKRRFVQEARAASSLNHPHIVTLHDIDEADGVHFIAMEYVDGQTLDQRIPRHGMRLNDALKVALEMADALAAAHQAGIIHRDLKPANIMVSEKGVTRSLISAWPSSREAGQ